MKKRRMALWVALVVAVGVLTLVEPSPLELLWLPPYKRIVFTKSDLITARNEIARFREATGRYPRSLDELSHNIYRGAEVGAREGPLCEYLSDRRGNSTEHATPDGRGGWYYNPATGEIRVNLDAPVRRYIRGYPDETGDQPPCEW